MLKRFDGRGVNQYTKDDDAAVITQKQAADDAGLSERKHADRIQARAVRRCGELLKTYNSPGARTDQLSEGAHIRLTQRQAVSDAGISERKHADRIQARAVRRCGELLKQFDGRGVNQYTKDDEGTLITQKQAASDAGLSDHQRVTAVRVANVPEPDFDAGISR